MRYKRVLRAHQTIFLLLMWASIAGAYKWSRLADLRDSDGVIQVTDENFGTISRGLRNYYSVLLVTSSAVGKDGERCNMCERFAPTWRQVASAFASQPLPKASTYAFFEVDLAANPAVARKMQMQSTPHCIVLPPTMKDEESTWFAGHFYRYNLTAADADDTEKLANFLGRTLGVWVQVQDTFDIKLFFQTFAVFLIVFVAIKKFALRFVPRWKFISGLLSLLTILVSITGFKFAQINGIPFLMKDERGDILYFAASASWQFGVEILSVSLMYLVMALAFLSMIWISTCRQTVSLRVKSIVAVFANLTLFYTFLYFLSCYKVKLPSYPYAI